MRTPVYVLYGVAVPLLIGATKNHLLPQHFRTDVLGYDIGYVATDSMAPSVLGGDYVLADTKYYRQHAPTVGDIVIARPVSKEDEYVRRVRVVNNNSVWVSADTLQGLGGTSANFLNNTELPLSNLKGRATYVVFSKDLKRIGTKLTEQDQPSSDPFTLTKKKIDIGPDAKP